MGFNLKILFHVVGIMVVLFLLMWCVVNTSFYATMLTLSLVLVFQVFSLFRFVSLTNRQLSRFLDAVKHSDFSLTFSHRKQNGSFASLGQSIDNVLERFREERSAREEQATFLQAFVEQVPVAVLAITDDDRITTSNKALRKLVGKSDVRHLGQINEHAPSLVATLNSLNAGDEEILKLKTKNSVVHLKLSCSHLRLKGRSIRLISLQDIGNELEAAELNAWQNLIRVMTHEIMNSITPITSLAETSNQYLKEVEAGLEKRPDDSDEPLKHLVQDAGSAIETIGKRSQGLMRFVDSYRTLTRLPEPEFARFRLVDLLQGTAELMAEQVEKSHVTLSIKCSPENLELNGDRSMLEQALINLILNALDAVKDKEQPAITLLAKLRDGGGVIVEISDNGAGIEAEHLENIFIPFFTTKRGGSGIGMSIVRQIVKLNGGQVGLESAPGKGTTLTLSF